ncbi:unnamed protein product [Blepharisma stoltei]|uniref:Uncharacterized protein n=1 Tax=Blepharisma stoltei TaxID=1481888 RepID=A0AAU9JEZ3_9CILI|nr:unnamed protein product [Blepharisma stoltei]
MSGDLAANVQENDFTQNLEGIQNIGRQTIEEAQQMYAYFKQNDPHWNETKANNVKKCAILVASKSVVLHTVEGEEIKGDMLSLSQIIKISSDSDMNSMIHQLKEFISIVKIPEPLSHDIHRTIQSFAMSLLIYKKFQEIWKTINFQGDVDYIHQIFHTAWLLLITARAYLLGRNGDIFHCGCLIIGVLHLVLTNLPNSVSVNMNASALPYLCSLLQAQADQALPWIEKLSHFIVQMRDQGFIKYKGNHQTARIFAENVINFNITSLGAYYQKSMNLDDFDERDLSGPTNKIATPMKNRMGLTPFTRRGIVKKGVNGKTLNWDENENKIDIHSNLNEIPAQSSPFVVPPTPMTSAMEMNSWLSNVLDENLDYQLREICKKLSPDISEEIEIRLERQSNTIEDLFTQRGVISINGNDRGCLVQYFDSIDGMMAPSASKSNHKVQEVKKLYKCYLIKMIKEEMSKEELENVLLVMKNDAFHQSLYACCLESILYAYSVTSISFEDVLHFTHVLPFEFWKQINKFGKIDSTMPLQLKRHFKEIEIKILSHLGWKEDSPVYGVIKQVISNNESCDINHKSFQMYFRRFLSQAAQKILDLTNAINAPEHVKEKIWSSLKYLLSEKTEILINRHLDQLILCTIYGVCKLSECPMNFKTLMEKYSSFYNEEEGLFNHVYIDTGRYEDIIKFYNKIYIPSMKDKLKTNCFMEMPRIGQLCPESPLRAVIPTTQFAQPTLGLSVPRSPIRSPFLTPRTKALFAVSESPSHNSCLNINFPQKSSRELDFNKNGPTKKLKVLAQIFDKSKGESIGTPTLKKE